jgi:hypothetical protein
MRDSRKKSIDSANSYEVEYDCNKRRVRRKHSKIKEKQAEAYEFYEKRFISISDEIGKA